jgi:surface polysaccharide O-acyltransferase-like enzyme
MRYTPLWILLCILSYTALKYAGGPIQSLEDGGHITELQARLLYRPIWALSCTASCIAFLSLFHRYFQKTNLFWKSLAANAYGIYLIHWVFVLWIQYLLLPVSLGPVTKFALTFIGATTLSWIITAMARQIPVIKKYV